jgi:hypothetical protein
MLEVAKADAPREDQGQESVMEGGPHFDPSRSPTAASSALTLSRWGMREGSGAELKVISRRG